MDHLVRRIRFTGLLSVTEGSIGYPYFIGNVHRNKTAVKYHFRYFIVVKKVPVKIWVFYVHKRIFLTRTFKQISFFVKFKHKITSNELKMPTIAKVFLGFKYVITLFLLFLRLMFYIFCTYLFLPLRHILCNFYNKFIPIVKLSQCLFISA